VYLGKHASRFLTKTLFNKTGLDGRAAAGAEFQIGLQAAPACAAKETQGAMTSSPVPQSPQKLSPCELRKPHWGQYEAADGTAVTGSAIFKDGV
jgi:hypothetical protein